MMREKLKEDYRILQKQFVWLELSYDECSKIGLQKTFDEVLEYSVALMQIMKNTEHYVEHLEL